MQLKTEENAESFHIYSFYPYIPCQYSIHSESNIHLQSLQVHEVKGISANTVRARGAG